jgi:hypothetical protein
MKDNELLAAAMAYAGRGWAVFPLAVGDKVPLIPKKEGGNGCLDATTDPAQIRAWWTANPQANIGITAGASGLLLVDVDAKDGRDGFTSWAALRAEHAFEDTTPHVWTPNDGKHLYFAAPAGVHLRNTDDELGPGIETKANGKYCVAPPSRLRDGRAYRWDERLNLDAVSIAPVPEPLQRLLERQPPAPSAPAPIVSQIGGSRYAAKAFQDEIDHLARATEGTRNATLNRCAFALGQLVAGGELDRFTVEQDLLAVALRIGLGEGEAATTIKSGLDAGAREPRTTPPPTLRTYAPVSDEPPAWLPGEDGAPILEPPAWLSDDDLAAQVHAPSPATAHAPKPDLSECPPLPAAAQLDPSLGLDASLWLDAYLDFSRRWAPRAFDGFHESVALWVLSTVAARRVKLDFGGERFPSLYLANVARSSVWTKSTAHHIGAALLDACGLSFLLAPDEATPQALLFRMSIPPTVADWDAKPVEEKEQATLALSFAGQKGWDYDEFGGKVSAMMRDSGSMADFRGILRRFDDAPPAYVYVTVGRGENRLQRPYLALLGSMTPADMGPYAKRGGALWHDGFWARFAFVAPAPEDQPTMGKFPDGVRILPPALLTPLRTWHDRLGRPDMDIVQRKDADGKPTRDFDVTVTARPPEDCTLGRGVCDAFYAYHDALTTLAAGSDNTDLDGNYSRFAEKALRVAMLLASLENGGKIELRHWARAQQIAERWRRSLHNLYRTLNAGQDEEVRNEDRVMEIVRRLSTATPTDVHRYAPDISTSSAASILERLAHAGALQMTEKTRKGTPRYSTGES